MIMCVTTFMTQKQIMKRSGPVEGQAATVQRLMLYGMPLSLFVSGFIFPIGVLLYWVTNNAWTFGQQFFILRKMPPPGSDAAQGEGCRREAGRRPPHARPEAGCQAGAHEGCPARRCVGLHGGRDVDRRPHRGAVRCRRSAHRAAGRPRRSRQRAKPAAPRPAAKGKRKRR